MLSRFIDQLSNELGWKEPVTKENDDSYILLFEPNVRVAIKEENSDVLKFFSQLKTLPADREGEYMLKMMSANLFGKHTGRNVFGLSQDEKGIVLLHFLLGSVSYKQWRDCLEDFVNYTEVLGDEITAQKDGN